MQFKGDKTSTMLVEQYRMNETIMKWSSEALYHNKLVAHPDVKDRLVDDIMTKEKLEETLWVPLLPSMVLEPLFAFSMLKTTKLKN